MRELISGPILFIGFLLTAAVQDFQRKKVKLWVYAFFGVLALVLDGYLWIMPDYNFLESVSFWQDVLWKRKSVLEMVCFF